MQVEGVINFANDVDEIVQWDTQIQSICVSVNSILDNMVAKNVITANA